MDDLNLESCIGLLELIKCFIKFLSCKCIWKIIVYINLFGGIF